MRAVPSLGNRRGSVRKLAEKGIDHTITGRETYRSIQKHCIIVMYWTFITIIIISLTS